MRTLALVIVMLASGCFGMHYMAKRDPRRSPRSEAGYIVAIGAAQILLGAAITAGAVVSEYEPNPEESGDSWSEGGARAKHAGGMLALATLGAVIATMGIGEMLGGALQASSGVYFLAPPD